MHGEPQEADGGNEGGSQTPSGPSEEGLITVPLDGSHRTADFKCARSERIRGFFAKEYPEFSKFNYTKVFVYPHPEDSTRIMGYYTLSAALILRRWLINRFQKKVPGGIPAPMALLGFVGRDDEAQRGLGAALIHDAALRVSRVRDIGIWGLTLDAENEGLAKYYGGLGFELATNPKNPGEVPPLLMYAPLATLSA